MSKQLALLLAAVLAMGLVTGCSPSGEESSQNQSSTSSQSQTAETTGSSSDYLFEEGSTMLQFTKPADSAEIAVKTSPPWPRRATTMVCVSTVSSMAL